MSGVKEYIFPVYDVDLDEFHEYVGYIRTKPELIRCKDCKYWGVSKSNIMNHTCYWGYFLKKEDDYCSWAKPKEIYEKEEDKGTD